MGILEFLFGTPRKKEAYRSSLPASLGSISRSLPQQPSVLDLQLGAVVSYDGTDFIVRRRQVYDSHGFQWYSFYLVDPVSGRKLWLDAEDDDELEVAVCEPVDLDLPLPVPMHLHWQNRTYRLTEHGFARVLIESEDSQPRYTQVEYWDFSEKDEKYALGVEKWGGEWEVMFCRAIEPYALTIFSGGKPFA